jgi:hypothetical protein
MGTAFAAGKKALGICDRCGLEYKLSKLRSETVKGRNLKNLVCPSCFDPDHPQLMVGMYPISDPQALQNARPDSGFTVSRQIQWGWAPVGGSDGVYTPNDLIATGEVGTVTVTTS